MVAKNANYMLFATAVAKVRPVTSMAIDDAIEPAAKPRCSPAAPARRPASTRGSWNGGGPATFVFPRNASRSGGARRRGDDDRLGARSSHGWSLDSSNAVASRTGGVAARGLVRSTDSAMRRLRFQ